MALCELIVQQNYAALASAMPNVEVLQVMMMMMTPQQAPNLAGDAPQ